MLLNWSRLHWPRGQDLYFDYWVKIAVEHPIMNKNLFYLLTTWVKLYPMSLGKFFYVLFVDMIWFFHRFRDGLYVYPFMLIWIFLTFFMLPKILNLIWKDERTWENLVKFSENLVKVQVQVKVWSIGWDFVWILILHAYNFIAPSFTLRRNIRPVGF